MIISQCNTERQIWGDYNQLTFNIYDEGCSRGTWMKENGETRFIYSNQLIDHPEVNIIFEGKV